MKIQVNPRYIRALRHIAADKDIRYYLNGVLFHGEPTGKFYVATDGHRIGVFFEEWGDDETIAEIAIIIPREVCAALKPSGALPGFLYESEKDKWILETTGGAVAHMFSPIDGKYPDWRRTVPAKTSGEPGAYNWNYMQAFDKCLKEAAGTKSSCELFPNGLSSAALVTSPSETNFMGVIMPLVANNPKIAAMPRAWFGAAPANENP